VDAAIEMAVKRRGRWFDPSLVRALQTLRRDAAFWDTLKNNEIAARLGAIEPSDRVMLADDGILDRICWGFAQVVDAKSPWTYRHSEGVSQIAVGIGPGPGLHA
jgi:HD-GYP domain-containing protein (c-di-GMP phosphodiesterase class II)